jgi:streptogramin lyase
VGTGFPWGKNSEGGLNQYLPAEDRFLRYPFPFPSDISSEMVFYSYLVPAEGENLWIFGKGWGKENTRLFLFQFNPQTGEFEPYPAEQIEDPVFGYEPIHEIVKDSFGNLWLCSNTKLKRIHPTNGESLEIRAADFGVQYFKDMTLDDQGRIWLLGDQVSMYDPHTGDKLSFVVPYWVQPTAGFTDYIFRDTTGMIYFGGEGGFQRLDPRKLGNQPPKPPIETII